MRALKGVTAVKNINVYQVYTDRAPPKLASTAPAVNETRLELVRRVARETRMTLDRLAHRLNAVERRALDGDEGALRDLHEAQDATFQLLVELRQGEGK
jgi:hypothetical protein